MGPMFGQFSASKYVSGVWSKILLDYVFISSWPVNAYFKLITMLVKWVSFEEFQKNAGPLLQCVKSYVFKLPSHFLKPILDSLFTRIDQLTLLKWRTETTRTRPSEKVNASSSSDGTRFDLSERVRARNMWKPPFTTSGIKAREPQSYDG